MVSLQILSDLHIENIDNANPLDFITPSADILVLAGDIGRIHKIEQLTKFLTQICALFEQVIYVLGNHEYYMVDGIEPKTMNELIEIIQSATSSIKNLHILNRSSVVIDDVCIIGCTLWSLSSVGTPANIIRIAKMTPKLYNYLHRLDLAYIKMMIKYCRQNQLKLVVVSHHCPSFLCSKYKNQNTSLYCSNLDKLLTKTKIHTWICGHVHWNFDFFTKRGTRVVSNQKGRKLEKVDNFTLQKIITI